jgi:hypothetical protein
VVSPRGLSLADWKERRKLVIAPFPTHSTPFAAVDRLRKSRFSPSPTAPHMCALVCSFGRQYCTACNYISLIWTIHLRFDGVVGYRICLTHRRPPVRARVEPYFFSLIPEHCPGSSLAPLLHSNTFCILACDATARQREPLTCISFFFSLLALAK